MAYVKKIGETLLGADGVPRYKGSEGAVEFPDDMHDDVVEAAEECPGECIFIEP